MRVILVLPRSWTDIPEPQHPHRSSPESRCAGRRFTLVCKRAFSDRRLLTREAIWSSVDFSFCRSVENRA
jgi:hypothetical protein